MELKDAVELIRSAVVGASPGAWADCGAGSGLFTKALLELLSPGTRVYAIDRETSRIRDLEKLRSAGNESNVVAIAGDIRHLNAIPELDGAKLEGTLFANSLHFVENPATVLASAAELLNPRGRIVVVEYDRRDANPWVPFPISSDRLQELAAEAGHLSAEIVGQRPSAFRGTMYCALLTRKHGPVRYSLH